MSKQLALLVLAAAATTLAGCGAQSQPFTTPTTPTPVGGKAQNARTPSPTQQAPAVNADEAQPQQPGKSVEDIPAANPATAPAQESKK